MECRTEMWEVGQAMRWQPIYEMWMDGATYAEIAIALGLTRSTVGVHVLNMRYKGWDMPYRADWCIPRSRAA
jgi:hypothetical protein